MDFSYSPRTLDLQAKLLRFMDEYIYPAEAKYEAEIAANTAAGKRWTPLNTIEELKPKARAIGLWNLFLPPTAGGEGAAHNGRDFGLSNSDYAPLAEIMGRVPWSSEVFNFSTTRAMRPLSPGPLDATATRMPPSASQSVGAENSVPFAP